MNRIDTNTNTELAYRETARKDRSETHENGNLLAPANYAAVGGTFELLMLMLQVSKSEKADARNQITVAESAQSAAEQEQVDSIRAKANSALAMSAVSFGISASNLANSNARIKAEGNVEGLRGSGNKQLLDNASTQLASAKAAEDFGTMQGRLVDSVGKTLETRYEAKAAEAQNRAGTLRRSAERLSSELDDLKGNEDKLISYARDIEAAKNRCTQIALQSR